VAMVDAYFSYLEHRLVLLRGFLALPWPYHGIEGVLTARWGTNCEQSWVHRCMPTVKRLPLARSKGANSQSLRARRRRERSRVNLLPYPGGECHTGEHEPYEEKRPLQVDSHGHGRSPDSMHTL
jgi:hypothetical protein